MKIIAAPLLALLVLAAGAIAQDRSVEQFGDHKVYYSAFNSSFITPEVADVYSITRGKDKGLVNIAVVPGEQPGGTTALVTGVVNDLLQRQQVLEFREVREGDAVYYLAPFEFEHEDPLTFKVTVRPADSSREHSFTFQRTFYHDD